ADRGTTVTPTLTSAGVATNTVPAAGEFAVDVRVRDAGEMARIDSALRALTPVLSGARVEVVAVGSRPPLPAYASADLFSRAQACAGRLGLRPLSAAEVGGGSDGNF